jgi:hypothetical protein
MQWIPVDSAVARYALDEHADERRWLPQACPAPARLALLGRQKTAKPEW